MRMEDYNDIFLDYIVPTNINSDDNFNIFNVLDIEYDEVRLHSRMLKYFIELDQGKSFLKLLTVTFSESEKKACLEQCMSSENVEVIIEKSINSIKEDLTDGRIDLLIKFNDFSIIIENKIFAKDQENQLIKYHNYVESKEKFLLLYLTPDGRSPDLKSTDDENTKLKCHKDYHLISYKNHILKWLQEYEVTGNKSREILEQYITTLKKICRIMTEEDKTRIFGLLNKENFAKNIQNIKSDIETIEEQIHGFWLEVCEKIKTVSDKKVDFKKGSIMIEILSDKRGQMNFYLEYKPNFNDKPFIGIWFNRENAEKYRDYLNRNKEKYKDEDPLTIDNDGYLQKQELNELFTKDVFLAFIENKNIQDHLKLIADKISTYLKDNEKYIDFLNIKFIDQ
jgi:hypothetical protein